MTTTEQQTLAKLAALQARCDRLERAVMTMATWIIPEAKALCKLDEIIKGE